MCVYAIMFRRQLYLYITKRASVSCIVLPFMVFVSNECNGCGPHWVAMLPPWVITFICRVGNRPGVPPTCFRTNDWQVSSFSWWSRISTQTHTHTPFTILLLFGWLIDTTVRISFVTPSCYLLTWHFMILPLRWMINSNHHHAYDWVPFIQCLSFNDRCYCWGGICMWFIFPMFVMMEVNRSIAWCAECLSADTLTMPTLHLRPDHSPYSILRLCASFA